MNIIQERRTVREMTPAVPRESNALELTWRGVRFLVRAITEVCKAITSTVPIGYEDETGFHYGVAEALLIPIRTRRIPSRSPRESVLRRGGDNADLGF